MRLYATLAMNGILLAGCAVVPHADASSPPPPSPVEQAAPVPDAVAHSAPVACPYDPPVLTVQGTDFYSDGKASIPDPKRQAMDGAQIKPLQTFISHLNAIVDDRAATPEALACAQTMLSRWAAVAAMRPEPATTEGAREKARFVIGFNVVALKLKAAGHPVDAATGRWLNMLSHDAIQDFNPRDPKTKNRWFNNLYVWSGVDAASNAVLSGDPALRDYATEVWRTSLADINPNGTLKTELARGGRALLYHQYYLSGLLMLQSYRTALGDAPSPMETAKLKLLANFVSANLCDSTELKGLVGGLNQEMPPPYQFAAPAAFGHSILDRRWYQCAKLPTPLVDSAFGGDMAPVARVLAAVPGK